MSDSATRHKLAHHYLALSADAPLSKISVSMITQASGMSRKTFYRYFRDREQLTLWIFQTTLARTLSDRAPGCLMRRNRNGLPFYLASSTDPLRTHYLFLDALSACLVEHKAFFAQSLRETQPGSLAHHIVEIYTPAVSGLIVCALAPDGASAESIRLTADLYLRALLAFYREHLGAMTHGNLTMFQNILYCLADSCLCNKRLRCCRIS